jgi:hypothetical protein
MPQIRRSLPLIAATALGVAALNVPPALASTSQEAIFQDDIQLLAHPARTIETLRTLGVSRIRVFFVWSHVAPRSTSSRTPSHFKAGDPGAYPAANWAPYDEIVRDAQAAGIGLDVTLTGGAPRWATGSGMPSGGKPYFGQWRPSASAFGSFVRAVGARYSGSYTPRGASGPLPRVSFWAIWNEPNYGIDLAPQATNHDTVEVGAAAYRGLLDAAWGSLRASGHSRDTILIGETAPRGLDHPIGNFSGVKPLRFLRALYCVDSRYNPLRGSAARARGCPTTSSGSAQFRSHHPALFSASGYADHPYPGVHDWPPNVTTALTPDARGNDPDFADLPKLPQLERVLDRLNRIYGSRTRFPIWNTEYGYQTRPPERQARIGPTTAAYYLNWGEYLSWRQPRLRSYDQYLIADPVAGNFASGLEFSNGSHKPTFDAYRLPLYLPRTAGRKGRALEVWGGARPAHFGGARQVALQFQAGSRGPFKTIATVPVSNPRGYFDIRQKFSSSGTVRLAWSYASGQVVHSRSVAITLR